MALCSWYFPVFGTSNPEYTFSQVSVVFFERFKLFQRKDNGKPTSTKPQLEWRQRFPCGIPESPSRLQVQRSCISFVHSVQTCQYMEATQDYLLQFDKQRENVTVIRNWRELYGKNCSFQSRRIKNGKNQKEEDDS